MYHIRCNIVTSNISTCQNIQRLKRTQECIICISSCSYDHASNYSGFNSRNTVDTARHMITALNAIGLKLKGPKGEIGNLRPFDSGASRDSKTFL